MTKTQTRQMNILVVDDEKAFLHAVQRLFQTGEFSVDTAETFKEAIDLINEREFDVVLTDIRLTDVMSREGLEILKYLRENSPGTRVIILTGYGNPEIMERAYDMGASLYLEKPISANILRSIIRNQGNLR